MTDDERMGGGGNQSLSTVNASDPTIVTDKDPRAERKRGIALLLAEEEENVEAPSSPSSPINDHSKRLTVDVPTLSMTSLPRAMMELVLSFAVKDLSIKVKPTKRAGWRRLARPKVPITILREWQSVCKYWRDLLHEIITHYQQRLCKLNLSHKLPQQQRVLLDELIARGDMIVDLRIELYGQNNHRATTRRAVNWHELLRSCPNLQRLDTSKMKFLTRRDLRELLDAASLYCLKMQALILPLPLHWDKFAQEIPHFYDNDDNDTEVLQQLVTSLERWFVRGPHQGLRQLVFPHLRETSETFVTAITKFCPQIEVLDGWKLTFTSDGYGAVLCDEEWQVSLTVWEFFCQTCVHLREFNWSVVPFADNFFHPFGATKKYRLTELLIDFTDAFHHDSFTDRQVTAADILQPVATENERGYRSATTPSNSEEIATRRIQGYCDESRPYTSEGLCALIHGVPYLKVFKVFFHPRCRININVFGDKFLLQVAQSNPYMEYFSLTEAGEYCGPQAISSATDKGLTALSKMAHLADISITALQDGAGKRFFSFIYNISPVLKQRNIKIGILNNLDRCILPLVNRLIEEPSSNIEKHAFALLLVNTGYYRQLHREMYTLSEWEAELGPVKAALLATHPTVRFQLTLEKQKTKANVERAYCIAKFALFSTSWRYPDVIGGTFYRGDIDYDPTRDSFEWVVAIG